MGYVNFLMAFLLEQCISIKFNFILQKNAMEIYEMLTLIFSDNAIQTFDLFSQFRCVKLQLRTVNFQVAQTNVLRKFAKSSVRTTEVSF